MDIRLSAPAAGWSYPRRMPGQRIHPGGWTVPPGYSHAIASGGGRLLFVSGQVPIDEQGRVVPGDFEAQVVKVFENLATVLAAGGASFEQVIRFGYFVVGLDDEKLAVVRRVRTRMVVVQEPPASTLIGVQRLYHADVLVEIEAVAELA
jgi:enamine deaminase RidA (YjgF/YER057c/UK114 family)